MFAKKVNWKFTKDSLTVIPSNDWLAFKKHDSDKDASLSCLYVNNAEDVLLNLCQDGERHV
jgi:hypothetical protein